MVTAIIVSLLAGATIVVSRYLNAGLAKETGPIASTVYNYVVGLGLSIVVFLIMWGLGGYALPADVPAPWVFTGGLVGVVVVVLSNITAHKISSFHMTLILFVAQVFSGVGLDYLLTRQFSPGILAGGVAVAIGLCINLFADKRQEA